MLTSVVRYGSTFPIVYTLAFNKTHKQNSYVVNIYFAACVLAT